MASSSPQRHPDDITHHLLRAFGVLAGVSVLAVVVWLVTASQATASRLPTDTALDRVEPSAAPPMPMPR
ncbi:putative conserved membrane protein [Synechococcus sp. BIOS-U3-1]|uniref:hypothetical protein n=1 Tax=Synechococcus sp. BIOS-U3-1 TaxID=1400865 RepID=UPI000C5250D8|nr:hypothetical protein [Synechococcus sp. BIOS-U3-1]MAD68088.1 hypothetical protein [Synechococcus sp. CPC100]QNI60214.1 putative conserved membrane protein [Synechococcus sp. BIOS-U3-1]